MTVKSDLCEHARTCEEHGINVSVSRFADYESASRPGDPWKKRLVEQISDQLAQDIFDRTLGNW
jgi:hypothetical protein